MKDGESDGKGFFHVTREAMEVDIDEGKYLEHGEFSGNLYGTKLSSIRAVMRSGKMCILDCNPKVCCSLIIISYCLVVLHDMLNISREFNL